MAHKMFWKPAVYSLKDLYKLNLHYHNQGISQPNRVQQRTHTFSYNFQINLIFSMASVTFFVTFALISAIIAPALAKEFTVGDEAGWKTNFDYKTWAASKEFHVGDKLSTSIITT